MKMLEFSEQQTQFLNDPARLRIMGGSAIGVGKTFVGYYEALRLSRAFANNFGVIFTDKPAYQQMRFIDMMQLQTEDYSFPTLTNEKEMSIRTPEGGESTILFLDNCVSERVLFGGRRILSQFYPLQAMNLGFVMFEDIDTLSLEDVEDIFHRLRRGRLLRVNAKDIRMWGTAKDKPDWIDTLNSKKSGIVSVTLFNRKEQKNV